MSARKFPPGITVTPLADRILRLLGFHGRTNHDRTMRLPPALQGAAAKLARAGLITRTVFRLPKHNRRTEYHLNRTGQRLLLKMDDGPVCRYCGCTEHNACWETVPQTPHHSTGLISDFTIQVGCGWHAPNVCDAPACLAAHRAAEAERMKRGAFRPEARP